MAGACMQMPAPIPVDNNIYIAALRLKEDSFSLTIWANLATRHIGWWRCKGLFATLHNLDLAFDGPHHNALSDAINAAKILAQLNPVRE